MKSLSQVEDRPTVQSKESIYFQLCVTNFNDAKSLYYRHSKTIFFYLLFSWLTVFDVSCFSSGFVKKETMPIRHQSSD